MKLYGKHTQDVATRIVQAFQYPESLPKALAPIFIARNSDIPCRRWSWTNQLLVAFSGSADARGIRQWEQAGRTLKKGCSAVWILAPCNKTITVEDEDGEKHKRQILFGFRSIPVFRVEDTEGDPLPESPDTYANWVQKLPLKSVADEWGIHVDAFSHRSGSPLGYYQYGASGQAIMLGVENLSTWAHEMIHAADHRLGGLKEERWHREVVAELGGAVLLQCLGKPDESDLGGAYDYIASYAQSANKKPIQACIQVLDRVCNCVRLILDTAESHAVQQAVRASANTG